MSAALRLWTLLLSLLLGTAVAQNSGSILGVVNSNANLVSPHTQLVQPVCQRKGGWLDSRPQQLLTTITPVQTLLSTAIGAAGLRNYFSDTTQRLTLFAPSDTAIRTALKFGSIPCTTDFYSTDSCSSANQLLEATNLRALLLNLGTIPIFCRYNYQKQGSSCILLSIDASRCFSIFDSNQCFWYRHLLGFVCSHFLLPLRTSSQKTGRNLELLDCLVCSILPSYYDLKLKLALEQDPFAFVVVLLTLVSS